jgi:hypothetical protein
MSSNLYTILAEKYPFISIITYGAKQEEFVCIIQNADSLVTCIYDFGSLRSDEERKLFLELGEKWWWESSKLIGIDLFLKNEFVQFQKCLKVLITRECNLVIGPCTSLALLSQRKKRRSTIVVKKL